MWRGVLGAVPGVPAAIRDNGNGRWQAPVRRWVACPLGRAATPLRRTVDGGEVGVGLVGEVGDRRARPGGVECASARLARPAPFVGCRAQQDLHRGRLSSYAFPRRSASLATSVRECQVYMVTAVGCLRVALRPRPFAGTFARTSDNVCD